jgi:hypothetical protein
MHETGTKIINCYDKYLLSVEDSEHPPLGKTGSALYDLYVNMKEQQKRKYYRV